MNVQLCTHTCFGNERLASSYNIQFCIGAVFCINLTVWVIPKDVKKMKKNKEC